MVSIRIAETFDLSTARNKIGLIGIHTPPRPLLERHFGGLMNNHKYAKLTGCDVYFACASTLPVDPNGVGTGLGQVNPSDLMNPVLYKAVSNNTFETVIARIYGGAEINSSTDGGSLTLVEGIAPSDSQISYVNDFNVYYGILSNPDGWRKAMPQVGFEMHGLKPLMYAVLTQFGNSTILKGNDVKLHAEIPGSENQGLSGGFSTDTASTNDDAVIMRGRGEIAPPIPLWRGLAGTPQGPIATDFPRTYVGAIIVPPCHTAGSRIYYRLRIVWHIELLGLTSHQNFGSFLEMASNGSVAYYNGYDTGVIAKSMDDETEMVDVKGLEISKIMEGAS